MQQQESTQAFTNIESKNLLHHLAIIMDGNGRWAQNRKKSRQSGHKVGAKNVRNITQWCLQYGIQFLTLYAFSTENWNRPKKEIDALMKLLEKYLKEESQTYHKNNIRFRAIGDIDFFYQPLKHLILDLESSTSSYTKMTQTLALNYGSKDEISRAFLRVIKSNVDLADLQTKTPKQIKSLIAQNLDTHDMPNVDLLVRTGGEQRLSNFLLWQASYAEFYFSKTLWPDFDTKELQEIISDFYLRQRRFGAVEQ
ncbi:undecaprenyl diphosphate synthetase [Helicobacter fennelliae]|uniref:Isoprenyl transferase n=1 Tax=Helicobacter fennelliae TaxID=215 RepID=A0A2X3BGE4_9HELI|nr:di-trans,poly-cis-decaprenylcistransferase [Helicobacter fennelliae]SQB98854.1 undecaprenyl diphosphate synthetase [Helicobacter fennelliae]